jgi:hypothetical protein
MEFINYAHTICERTTNPDNKNVIAIAAVPAATKYGRLSF